MNEEKESKVEFKAALILLLDLLEHGEVDRAIERIREILTLADDDEEEV